MTQQDERQGIFSHGGELAQSETQTHSFVVDPAESLRVTMYYDTVDDLDLVLFDPLGRRIDAQNTLGVPDVAYEEESTGENPTFVLSRAEFVMLSVTPGTWQIEVTGTSVAAGSVTYSVTVLSFGSPIAAELLGAAYAEVRPEQGIALRAALSDDGQPVSGASVTAILTLPDSSRAKMPMPEVPSEPGTYAFDYDPGMAGIYTFGFLTSGSSCTP
jgi:hypothetical protein